MNPSPRQKWSSLLRLALGVVAWAGCSSTGEGPTNLLAELGACDGLSMASDPRCACCSNFEASASADNIPLCLPGAGYGETSGTRTSACAPENAAVACGARCPEGAGCVDGLCESCVGPGERCEGRACCCPGESEARRCGFTCDCSDEADASEDSADGAFPGFGGFSGAGGSTVSIDDSPVDTSGRRCPPAHVCLVGHAFCECIAGDPPWCEEGTCVDFGGGRTLCMLPCSDGEVGDRCVSAAADVACGHVSCGLDFGNGVEKCGIFCADSTACPEGQTCRSLGGGEHKLCLP